VAYFEEDSEMPRGKFLSLKGIRQIRQNKWDTAMTRASLRTLLLFRPINSIAGTHSGTGILIWMEVLWFEWLRKFPQIFCLTDFQRWPGFEARTHSQKQGQGQKQIPFEDDKTKKGKSKNNK
jgi:hypothetical protein